MQTHYLCLQITCVRRQATCKVWVVSLVIIDGHLIFLRGLCGYACVKWVVFSEARYNYFTCLLIIFSQSEANIALRLRGGAA